MKFQENKARIGLVVDEYGDIQGLVTLEDILEEIVGDFTTGVSSAVSDEIHRQEDGTYIIEGTINIRELNREMSWHLPIDGPKTISGLIIEHMQDIPSAGISFRIDGYPIEVLEVNNNMIQKIKISPGLFEPKSNPNVDSPELD